MVLRYRPMVTNLQLIAKARSLAESGEGRAVRERARVHVREVAREVRVSPSTVLRWEAGETFPRAEAAVRWVRALERLEAVSRAAS